MRCPRCQHENRLGRRFCSECGAPLALPCPSCGFSNEPGEKFCGGCGQPLGALRPSTAKFASPDSYTPRHLAEKILTSRTALEGERKQVTVLFADLKGSMELLADRDPEEARRILDPVLEQMMEAVHRYEGTVNQVMGDGIMALFGAPVAHEDHAVRACYAALRLQASVRRFADEARRAHGVTVQVRVGLNSGEVVVRAIGSDLHMDYTAVGQTTHLAARMEQLASPGTVLMTPATLALAEGYVEVKSLGPVPVKGLTEPVDVHELTGAVPVRSRLHAAAARGLTKFVGRTQELGQLAQALERARAGHGQVVAVVGEAGVGKSRLYWEFSRSHRTRDWLILQSSSVSYGKASPYLPTIDLLRAYFQIEARDEPRKIREKVTGKVLSLDRALEPALPPLLSLLDAPPESGEWDRLAPPQRRQRTLEAVKRLLLREAQVQPLLVLFEDLHWIDAETQALLDSLVDGLPTARLLLLVSYRPDYRHGWGGKSYYRQLRIDPLPAERAEELLRGLLGDDPELARLKRLLIDRTEGNPFFLEESVRTLVETRGLVGDAGGYRLGQALTRIQVPPTVQAILAARIDRLSAEDKRLLQSASAIGKEVPLPLLSAIADLPDDALHQGLGRLQGAEFLHEASLFPEVEYTFRHALTHEVAHAGLLHERRLALNARIVGAIERLYPDRLADHVERLAQHALRGEVWDKAVSYLDQAASKASALGAYREALHCLEEALGALGHLPESRETLERAIDLRLHIRHALLAVGDLERLLEYLREAAAIAETLGDRHRLGRVSSFITNHHFARGDHERALESGQRDLELAVAHGDRPLEAVARYYLGQIYHALGDYRRAIDVLRRATAILTGDLLHERLGQWAHPSVAARDCMVRCLAELGEFAEGTSLGEEALRIAEVGHVPTRLTALGLGLLHLRRGSLGQAIPVLERGLEVGSVAELPLAVMRFAAPLAEAYALAGRHEEALRLAEQTAEQLASLKALVIYTAYAPSVGEAYLLAGHREEALRLARRALELCREHKERGHEAWTLRLLGDIAAHPDAPDGEAAERHYRDALAVADELGMRPLVAHCHLGLARLFRLTARHAQARTHLTTATTMYRAMDMTYWLAQTEKESKGAELDSAGGPHDDL
jgi:class 3 adenylate cyclase/tetratricopeptide (TPR) repeat protein